MKLPIAAEASVINSIVAISQNRDRMILNNIPNCMGFLEMEQPSNDQEYSV